MPDITRDHYLRNDASHWCQVHEVDHPRELTMVYEIEFGPNDPYRRVHRGRNKVMRLRLCNDVAVDLGLTTRDVIPTP